MKRITHILLFLLSIASCTSQSEEEVTRVVGGPCEGCEALYEYGERKLTSVDTLPGFKTSEPKLILTGTVYHKDGKTPAENVILYTYHTNRKGVYESRGDEEGWGRRHGFIRGWIRTGRDGTYAIYTVRPAAYPGGSEPEHIHMVVKEPGLSPYYIDDIVFSDDPLLTDALKENTGHRGGSGLVKPDYLNGKLIAVRDVVLGRNIPNYE